MLALRRLLVSRGETHHHTGRFVVALNTRSAVAAAVVMGELTAERPARPPVSFSFCTQSTAIESPLVAMRNPTVGFASVCAGMLTRVHALVIVMLVQVAPPSIVISTGPEPLSRLTKALC